MDLDKGHDPEKNKREGSRRWAFSIKMKVRIHRFRDTLYINV